MEALPAEPQPIPAEKAPVSESKELSYESPSEEVVPQNDAPEPARPITVPIVSLGEPIAPPSTDGDAKVLDTAVADGTAANETTIPHGASTHIPLLSSGKVPIAETVPPTELPAVPESKTAEPAAAPETNGKEAPADSALPAEPPVAVEAKPTEPVASPPPTPATKVNGSSHAPASQTTPHKERRIFPTLGRGHRRSSSSASASGSERTESPPVSPGKDSISSRNGSQKKRKSSLFGKIKDLFHHDDAAKHKSHTS